MIVHAHLRVGMSAGDLRFANDGDNPMPEALAYTIAEACAATRIGRTALYELIRDGRLPARKCGRRTVVLADDLRRWIESLPAIQPSRRK